MNNHRVSVRVLCRCGGEHILCLPIPREVHPDLQCEAPSGISAGGGGCQLPEDLVDRVLRELQRNHRKWADLGYVIIELR